MLKVTLIELILRAVPEAFIYMFAMYAFSGQKLDKIQYIKASIGLAMSMFAIRFLPISYGIHTILILMVIIAISVMFNKLNIVGVITASIINVVIQFMAEGINIMFIQYCLGKNLQEVVGNPISKTIYGVPSLILWALVITAYYRMMRKRVSKKND